MISHVCSNPPNACATGVLITAVGFDGLDRTRWEVRGGWTNIGLPSTGLLLPSWRPPVGRRVDVEVVGTVVMVVVVVVVVVVEVVVDVVVVVDLVVEGGVVVGSGVVVVAISHGHR